MGGMSYEVTVNNPNGFVSTASFETTAQLVQWAMSIGQSYDRNQSTFRVEEPNVIVNPRFGNKKTVIEISQS